MNRIRLKKQNKLKMNKLNLLILCLIIIVIGIVLVFTYVNKNASPIIIDYATLEARKFSSIIINKAISKHITEKIDTEELFQITQDSSGEIKAIDFNVALVNKFLTETTNSVQINLRNIEKGRIDALEFSDTVLVDYDKKKLEQGIIFEVSSGVIFGNPILANVGPKIPVKISLVGDAVSNISTEALNYGINNSLIQVYVNIKIQEQVILPFFEREIEVEIKVPVALKIVTGSVPKYYANGLTQNTPSLTIPIEE